MQIKNNTSEFLIFTNKAGKDGIEVCIQDETIWLTQKLMAALFDCTTENVIMHLKSVYTDGELDESSTTKDFLVVQIEGNRDVSRSIKHYNLDAIISVGYRVNSAKATQFRIWAISDFDKEVKKILRNKEV